MPIENNGRRPDTKARRREHAMPRAGRCRIHGLGGANHLGDATSPRCGDGGGIVRRRSVCRLRIPQSRNSRILISWLAPPQGRGHSLSVSPRGLGQKWSANARGPLTFASTSNPATGPGVANRTIIGGQPSGRIYRKGRFNCSAMRANEAAMMRMARTARALQRRWLARVAGSPSGMT